MCGIAGGLWHTAPRNVSLKIERALHHLRLRGPDDDGRLLEPLNADGGLMALLHKRLSVIDLSAGGHQPKTSHNGRYSLVFNGEIVNYRELRDTLRALGCEFTTESDTEVLLWAWERWGISALDKLVGMFAFAMLDRQARTLTLVRDAFGIKPLYYSLNAQEFVFGSVSACVSALRMGSSKVNLQRSYDYLVHGDYDSDAATFTEGIAQLQPGHLLVLPLEQWTGSSPAAWWRPKVEQNDTLSFTQATERLRETFLDSIRLHLRSDVPLGAALSGGLDSSAVVCAMRYVAPKEPIHTFSFIAPDPALSEEKWVDEINAQVGAVPHKITASAQELVRDLDALIEAQGEPFGSTSIYAQFRVFQAARQAGITVTLDGQGADELLAGYIGYPGQRMRSLIETGQWRQALQFSHQWSKWPGRNQKQAWMHYASAVFPPSLERMGRQWMGRSAAPQWLNTTALTEQGVRMQLPWAGRAHGPKGRRVIGQMASALTQRGLPGLLRHGDRNSMCFSVESRVPFLTVPMANLLLSLPEHYLIANNGETKHIFRAAMRGIVPDMVLDRKDKVGFATPELQWLTAAAPQMREWLVQTQDIPMLNAPAVLREFDAIVQGQKPFSWQAWRLVNFVRWWWVASGF